MNARSRPVAAAAIRTARTRGLRWLQHAQRPDGGFDSYSSPSAQRFRPAIAYQTTFVPALMLAALSGVPGSRSVGDRLAAFVRAQRSPAWSFNYWAKASPERERQPYPDDLDDTACALIGLALHDSESIDGAALAALVKVLVAAETQPGGPYRTWLVPPDSPAVWRDVDLAVNANIAYLLSLVSRPLPNLTALMEQAARTGRFASSYYPGPAPILYYLARAYRGPLAPRLAAAVRQQLEAKPASALTVALLLSALLRLTETPGAAAHAAAARLLAAQQTGGAWPAAAFCLDPARGGRRYYHGGPGLTTAFALEALQLYRQASAGGRQTAAADSHASAQPPAGRQAAGFETAVLAAVQRDCRPLAPALQRGLLDFAERFRRSETGSSVVLLPLLFSQSLTGAGRTPRRQLVQLGQANLYGWLAYTAFDDFLDEEGRPAELPVATAALRYSLAAFARALPADRAFQQLVRETFDTIDGANAWELAHCRSRRQGTQLIIEGLPDYGAAERLADRSLGHALTPLAVLRLRRTGRQSRLFRGVRQAMVHYLTARQLNDDAHDWQADLERGHLTYVVTKLLRDEGIGPGSYGVPELTRRLQRRFWHDTLPQLCDLMAAQTAGGRQSLQGLPGLAPRSALTDLLDGIDASLAETRAAQTQAETFLQQYTTAGGKI